MTITIGWWAVPLLITIGTFFWCLFKKEPGGSGIMDGFFILIDFAVMCIIPSLIAWLVWAVLR